MIGKSILLYKIFEKLGSPREILLFNSSNNYYLIISPDNPREIVLFNILGNNNFFISWGKGGT